MSEKSKKELLEIVDYFSHLEKEILRNILEQKQRSRDPDWRRTENLCRHRLGALEKIKSLIENQPRVTRKELQKIALACSWASDETTLEKWLYSIGVVVEEKEAFNEG